MNNNNKLKQFYNDNFRKGTLNLSEESKTKVKEKIFANLGVQTAPEPSLSFMQKFQDTFLKTYVLVPLVVLLIICGTTGVAAASAHALPGDKLYPVKRQVESARILLAPTSDAKLDLEVSFAQERLNEAEALKVAGPEQPDDNINQSNQNTNSNQDDSDSNKTNSNAKPLHKQRAVLNASQQNARKQADDAVNFLNKTQRKFEQSGQNQQARDIQTKIDEFQKDVQDQLNNSGEVKGEHTINTGGRTIPPTVPIKAPDAGEMLH